MRPALRPVFARALRFRCPHCGAGKLFTGIFQVRKECLVCGLAFFREPGYFIVSMYANVVLTAATVTLGYVLSLFLPFSSDIPWERAFFLWMLFAVCVSLALTRFTRSLWLAIDFWLEPWSPRVTNFALHDQPPGSPSI